MDQNGSDNGCCMPCISFKKRNKVEPIKNPRTNGITSNDTLDEYHFQIYQDEIEKIRPMSSQNNQYSIDRENRLQSLSHDAVNHIAVSQSRLNARKSSTLVSLKNLVKSFLYFNQKNLNDYQKQLILSDSLRVFFATWNMNGIACPTTLEPMLQKSSSATFQDKYYHMIVFGTQECGKTASQSVFTGDKTKSWIDYLSDYLKPNYVLLKAEKLQGICLTVFVLKDIKSCIKSTSLTSTRVSTGLANVVGNKGGIAISLKFHGGESFMFINSHFAAHHENIEQRNGDYTLIYQELNEKYQLETFDNLIWMGDLNYRINDTRKNIDGAIQEGNLTALILKDQLTNQIAQNKVFQGWNEGEITFLPTYKFDAQTTLLSINKKSFNKFQDPDSPSSEYESEDDLGVKDILKRHGSKYDSSKKQRIQGYTDRILFKCKSFNLVDYDSCMQICQSDHKPVYSVMEFQQDWKKVFASVQYHNQKINKN